MVGAGIEVVIILTGGALATPCGTAIWTITAVEGTTALTAAGCSAPAGATSAATSAHFGNAETNNPIPPTGKGMISVTYIEPANSRLLGLFLSQKSGQMAASGRT